MQYAIKERDLLCSVAQFLQQVPCCATAALHQQCSQVANKLVYHMDAGPNCGCNITYSPSGIFFIGLDICYNIVIMCNQMGAVVAKLGNTS